MIYFLFYTLSPFSGLIASVNIREGVHPESIFCFAKILVPKSKVGLKRGHFGHEIAVGFTAVCALSILIVQKKSFLLLKLERRFYANDKT